MKCPQCKSETVQINMIKSKRGMLWIGAIFLLIGFTLFLGVIGLCVAFVVDIIIFAIAPKHKTVGVCQNCGNIFDPLKQKVSLSSDSQENSCKSSDNLTVIRNSSSTGSAVTLCIKVDDNCDILLSNGRSFSISVPVGDHVLSYRQINGIGKNKRKGVYHVYVGTDSPKKIYITLTPNGIDIKENQL